MSYKILDDLDLELNKVTNESLKILYDLGLLNLGDALTKEEQTLIIEALETLERGKVGQALMIMNRKPGVNELEIYVNTEKLKQIIKAIFLLSDEQIKKIENNIEKIDCREVRRALYNFFIKLNPF